MIHYPYLLIIITMCICFLRRIWFNIADKISNESSITHFEYKFYWLYPFIGYLWLGILIFAQYLDSIKKLFNVMNTIPKDHIITNSEINSITTQFSSKQFISNYIFFTIVIIYVFYVFWGLHKKDKEVMQKLEQRKLDK